MAVENTYKLIDELVISLEPIRIDYEIDEKVTSAKIEGETSVKNWSCYYDKFDTQIGLVDKVPSTIQMGFITFDLTQLKTKLTKMYRSNIYCLSSNIPKLFASKIRKLDGKTRSVIEQLEMELPPDGYLSLDELKEEINEIKAGIEDAYEVYNLMRKYDVFISDESKEDFMGEIRLNSCGLGLLVVPTNLPVELFLFRLFRLRRQRSKLSGNSGDKIKRNLLSWCRLSNTRLCIL